MNEFINFMIGAALNLMDFIIPCLLPITIIVGVVVIIRICFTYLFHISVRDFFHE